MNSFFDSRLAQSMQIFTLEEPCLVPEEGTEKSHRMDISNGGNRAVTFIKEYRKSLKVVGVLCLSEYICILFLHFYL